MFFNRKRWKTQEELESKQALLDVREKRLDEYRDKLIRQGQEMHDLATFAHRLGKRVSAKSFVTQVEITLSTKIGPVDVGLKVTIDPSQMLTQESSHVTTEAKGEEEDPT